MSDGPDGQQSTLSALVQSLFPEGSRRRTVAHWIHSYLPSDGRPDVEEYAQFEDHDDNNKYISSEPGSRGSASSPPVTRTDIGASNTHEPAVERAVTPDPQFERFSAPKVQVQNGKSSSTRVEGQGDLNSSDLYLYAKSSVEAALRTLGTRTRRGTWVDHNPGYLQFDYGGFQQTVRGLYEELDAKSQGLSPIEREVHDEEMKLVRAGSSAWDFGVFGALDGRLSRNRRYQVRSSDLASMSHLDGRQLGVLPTNWRDRYDLG